MQTKPWDRMSIQERYDSVHPKAAAAGEVSLPRVDLSAEQHEEHARQTARARALALIQGELAKESAQAATAAKGERQRAFEQRVARVNEIGNSRVGNVDWERLIGAIETKSPEATAAELEWRGRQALYAKAEAGDSQASEDLRQLREKERTDRWSRRR